MHFAQNDATMVVCSADMADSIAWKEGMKTRIFKLHTVLTRAHMQFQIKHLPDKDNDDRRNRSVSWFFLLQEACESLLSISDNKTLCTRKVYNCTLVFDPVFTASRL